MRNYLYDYLVPLSPNDMNTSLRTQQNQRRGIMRNGQIVEDPSLDYYYNVAKPELRSRNETPLEYAQEGVQNALSKFGMDKRNAQDFSRNITSGIGYAPVIGDILNAYDAPSKFIDPYNQYMNGDYGNAALNTGMALGSVLPVGGKLKDRAIGAFIGKPFR